MVAVELCLSRTTLLQLSDEQIIEKAQQLDTRTIVETLKRVRLCHVFILAFFTLDGHRARSTVLHVLVHVGAHNEEVGHGAGRRISRCISRGAFLRRQCEGKRAASGATGAPLPLCTGRSSNTHHDEACLWSVVVVAEAHARLHAHSFALE